MSHVKNATRLIHTACLRRMRRVATEGNTAWYDTEEGSSDIVELGTDRHGRTYETHVLADGNHRITLTIRNGDVTGIMSGLDLDRRLRSILHDVCDGSTQRMTAEQSRRMDLTTMFARLVTDDVDGMPIVFHPGTTLSAGWVEILTGMDDLAPAIHETAQWLCGGQRRVRGRLKGTRTSFDVEARGESRIAMPIRDTMDRLRAIEGLRSSAMAVGLDRAELESRLGGCGL